MIVEVLNKAMCNEEKLANPLCVTAEVLNNSENVQKFRVFEATEISHVS